MLAFHSDQKVKDKYVQRLSKAANSVLIVKGWLELKGFNVSTPKHPNSNGIDLTAMKNGETLTFEVKSVIYDGTSWRVNRCSNTDATYITFVLPSGNVHIDTMSDHLRLCAIDGSRRLTKLVKLDSIMADKFIELLEAPQPSKLN